MRIQKIDHIGIIVDDLDAAKAFFLDLGLELSGEGKIEGELVNQVTGLANVRSEIVGFRLPDGDTWLELAKFHTPPDENGVQPCAANTLGIRHISFAVEDIEADRQTR